MIKSTMKLIVALLALSMPLHAQFVSIINKKFVVNANTSCPIYFNGANTPWESWNDFGGTYNQSKWAQNMADLKAKGINASRIWFSCNGAGQPSVASDGTVSAPTQAFWNNCDHLFTQAQNNGVYIKATMMSFDHTKPSNTAGTNWQNMMNSQAKTQTYIDNYLIPFVNRYKTNPYLWCIDLCNEIEWIAENGSASGTDKNWGCSYAVLQRFIGQCAAVLHGTSVARTDGSKVLVTLGSAGMKWNATKMRNGSNGTGWQNNPDGNKWSDAALQAQFAGSNTYLDFYSPHYYGWLNQYYHNMFQKSPTDFGMDEKACVVGEMPARDPMPTPAMGQQTAYNNLKTLGWQGHMPWTSNITSNLTTEVGSLADFGAAALAFKNANASLIVPNCAPTCTTSAPTVTSPVNYCQNIAAVALTATGTTLKWYGTAQSGGTASTTAPTPSTSTVGTTTYYVSQTLNNCEGPRASITVTITANPSAPTTTAVAYCQNATATALTATGTALKWYGTSQNGGTASTTAPTPSTSATATTTYYVSQTSNNCESPRAGLVVSVIAPASLNAGNDQNNVTVSSVSLTATSTSNGTWSLVSGPAANVTFSPNNTSKNVTVSGLTTAGIYTFRFTIAAVSPCSAVTDDVIVNSNIITFSIDELMSSMVKVFPNPTYDNLNVETDGIDNVDVIVTDLYGKEILHAKGHNMIIPLENKANGPYLITVKSENGSITKIIHKR